MVDLQPPIIHLKQSILDKFTSEHLWGPQEMVYFASEVTKMHLNGGADSRILIISLGAIYVFRKRKGELVNQYNLVDIEKLSYIEPNIVTFLIPDIHGKSSPLTLQSDNALDIAKLILQLNRMCKISVPCDVKIESTPPNALTVPQLVKRPRFILQARIMQIAQKQQQRFPLEQLKNIAEWDLKPTPLLKLTNQFKCGPAAFSVATGLAWDQDLKGIECDNFAPASLQTFMQILFARSKSLTKVVLENYLEPPAENFNLPAPITVKVCDLTFKNCCSAMIFSFLNGLRNFGGRIKFLLITTTKLTGENFRYLFDLLNRLPCFMGLQSLRLEEGCTDHMIVEDLARFLPNIKITSLSIKKSNIDIALMLSSIFPNTSSIKILSLAYGKLSERIKENVSLPDSLGYLDISRSQVSIGSLRNILQILLSKPRPNPILLSLIQLMPIPSTESIVNCFNIQNPQPVIAEFIFSNNILLPEQTKVILNFLRTQKRLVFLNLTRCFNERIDESLKLVADFVIETKLEALELSSNPKEPLNEHLIYFLKLLTGKCSLSTLIIDFNGFGDQGLLVLKKFVESNPKLSSLSCDGALPEDPEIFVKVYSSFEKIDRVQYPTRDIHHLGDKVQMPPFMSSKLPLLNINQRISEYQSLGSNASSSDISPMDALVDFMGKMTRTLTGKSKEISYDSDELADIFKQSIPSSIHTNVMSWNQNADSDLMKLLNLSGDKESEALDAPLMTTMMP